MTGSGTAGATRFAVPDAIDPALLDGWDAAARPIELAGTTMGTRWTVRLVPPPGGDPAALRDTIEARLAPIAGPLSHWAPESLLSRYNRARAGSWTLLPPDFAAIMAAGLAVAARSGGAFDPALGRLTDLWGLGPRPAAAPPSPERITEARAASGWRRLGLARGGWLHQPGGLWLDLSGVAKGHAVDAVTVALRAAGVRHMLVEIGGECAGTGIRPDGDPWWIELETPPDVAAAPLRVALHGLAAATSGDYVRGVHTLDPASGRPLVGAARAVSVLHPSCMMADAWATAFAVLPPARAFPLAERERLAVRIIDRDGAERLSPALVAMIDA